MNNKYYTKRALDSENVHMPKDTLVTKYVDLDTEFFKEVDFPVIVKPNHEGSSVGISQNNICFSMNHVQEQIDRLLPVYDEIIIEELITGKDVTDFIVGNPNDIRINEAIVTKLHNTSPTAIYGAVEKVKKLRTLNMADEVFSKDTVKYIHESSERIFTYLNASDIARVDYRLSDKDGKLYFLEINTAPRFSLNTEVGYICEQKKLSIDVFIRCYIETSLKRNSEIFNFKIKD